jgi:hypothetical protein
VHHRPLPIAARLCVTRFDVRMSFSAIVIELNVITERKTGL